MKNCISCGKDMPKGLSVCPSCGAQNFVLDAKKLEKTKDGLLEIINNAGSGQIGGAGSPPSDKIAAPYVGGVKPVENAAPYVGGVKPVENAAPYVGGVKPVENAAPYVGGVKPAENAAPYVGGVKPVENAAPYVGGVKPAENAAPYVGGVKPAENAAPYVGGVKPVENAAPVADGVKPAENAAPLGIPSQYVIPIVLHSAPENEVYSAVDLHPKKKKRKRTRGEVYKSLPLVFLILDLLILATLMLNYTFSSNSVRGFEPIFALFGRGTNYEIYLALYIGKYTKIFAAYKYAFTAFAGLGALGIFLNLLLAGLPRAGRAVNGFIGAVQSIFIIAAAVFAVLIFGEKIILKGLGILVAAALILIKIITMQIRIQIKK